MLNKLLENKELINYLESAACRLKVIEFDESFKSISEAELNHLLQFLHRFCHERQWVYAIRDASKTPENAISHYVDRLIEQSKSRDAEDKIFKRLVVITNIPDEPSEALVSALDRLLESSDDMYLIVSFGRSIYKQVYKMSKFRMFLDKLLLISNATKNTEIRSVASSNILITNVPTTNVAFPRYRPSDDLKAFLYANFPLIHNANFDLSEINHESTIVKAKLTDHLNHHHTAFGGSIALSLLLSAMCHLVKIVDTFPEELSFVIGKQEVTYYEKINEDFVVRSLEVSDQEKRDYFARVMERGRGAIVIKSQIRDEATDKLLAEFIGKFVCIKCMDVEPSDYAIS